MKILNDNTNLTIVESLNLVGLVPSILLILYLIKFSKNRVLSILPIIFITSLLAEFVNNLWIAILGTEEYLLVRVGLQILALLIPSITFLLVIQLVLNKVPKLLYWFIILIPIFATTPFMLGYIKDDLLCLSINVCVESIYVFNLNNIIFSSIILMLLTIFFISEKNLLNKFKLNNVNKYWISISLIKLNIILLAIDLGLVAGFFTKANVMTAKVILKISFIYIITTAVFRVFTDIFEIEKPKRKNKNNELTQYEKSLCEKITNFYEHEKKHREINFCRAYLADLLHINEQMLSRIINLNFGKSFTSLTNEYRVEEAKWLLTKTDDNVTDISFDSGFKSLASFNRVFKSTTGLSPTEYREANNTNLLLNDKRITKFN